MIPVLYPANATDFSSFGLGVLTDTISCEVTEERNGVFECLLKYPVSGQHYGLITKECIIKAKPNDTAADQAFRIYRITKPLNGIVTIYGQHISYDLANVPVLPFSTESRSPQLILSQLLAGDTRFTGWTDYSDAKAFSVTQPKSVRACLGGTEGSMLSKWYGEFEWDNFTVKFHSHRGQKTGVVIEYGKNLTALEQDEDNSGVYTALLPYAVYTPEGSDAETVVTLPEVTLPIVTSEIVRAKTLIMDFSDQFDGDVTEEALRAKANSYIKANPLGATIPTVKVSFEPLWKQPEYSALLERVNLCDTVTIRHSLLGVSVSAMVIETVYDTLAERYKSISLGQSKSSMITTIEEQKMLRLVIISSNGNIFKNGNVKTLLSAKVYSWDEDITDTLDANQFVWTRVSEDTEADKVWNEQHFGGVKAVVITSADVKVRATFYCDLIDTTTRQSLL